MNKELVPLKKRLWEETRYNLSYVFDDFIDNYTYWGIWRTICHSQITDSIRNNLRIFIEEDLK